MNGLYFLIPVAIVYFLRKEIMEAKVKNYIREKGGRYISELPISVYKSRYIVKYVDAQKNIRRVRVQHKTFRIVFADDEIVE